MAVLLLLCVLCLAIPRSLAAARPQAVNVDDTSPLLNYSDINQWTTHVNVPSRWNLYSNTDSFSSVQGAWVSFTFKGTSIEYWGNQGPYHGPCLVTLEDGTSQTVSSHNSVDADPILLFSKYDLPASRTHTIKITVVDAAYPNVCELDRFAYTPLPSATSTSTPTSTSTSHSSSKSLKFIVIGAAVGTAFLVAVVFGCFYLWRRGSKRSTYPGGRNVLDDDFPTAQYASTTVVSEPVSPFTARPTSTQSQSGYLSTGAISHSPSILSSLSSNKQDPATQAFLAPSPYGQPAYNNPHLAFPSPHVPYQAPSDTSNEKNGGAMSVMADSSTGEGSSAMYYPLAMQNPSPSPDPVAASSSSNAPYQPMPAVPVATVPVAATSAPYQHQDAGRVPDEVPPAYKDSWGQR